MTERENLRAVIDASPFWDVDLSIRKPFFRALCAKLKSKEAGAKVRKAWEYMKTKGYTNSMVLENDAVKEEVAKAVDILPVSLCEALSDKNIVTSETPTLTPEWEEMYRILWAQTMELLPKEDPTVLTQSFFQSAGGFQRDEKLGMTSFYVYLRTTLKHERAREAQKEGLFTKGNAGLLRKALEYMDKMGYTENMVLHNAECRKTVAKVLKVSEKELCEALCDKTKIVSLNAPIGNSLDDGGCIEFGETIADSTTLGGLGDKMEAEDFPRLRAAVLLMNLKEKEFTRRNTIMFWSPRILKYLRAEEKPEYENRKSRCDDLRPLEQDDLLWDQLLLREFVQYTICEPLYTGMGPQDPRELLSAALNDLVDPARLPEQDKTVAAFLKKDKGTISSNNKRRTKEFLNRKICEEE